MKELPLSRYERIALVFAGLGTIVAAIGLVRLP